MVTTITPRVPKGFRDSLPAGERARRRLYRILSDCFESFGYEPIDTPLLEYAEILLGKSGGESAKQLYRFTDNGGRDVALRFDLTVPLARFLAQHRQTLLFPFRRYHTGKVFRGENTQRGRYREFVQCDFDIIGTDSPAADFEILQLVGATFAQLDIADIDIRLSHRGLLAHLLARHQLGDKLAETLRILDRLPKVGLERVRADLEPVVDRDVIDEIMQMVAIGGPAVATLATLRNLPAVDRPSLQRLEQIVAYATATGLDRQLQLDLSITRGLDYYTGMVFETYLRRLPDIGAVCSGGRYDDLVALYSPEPLAGVGGSVGIDRLLAALDELGDSAPAADGACDLIIFCLDPALSGHYQQLAGHVRAAGMRCEAYPEARKLSRQFVYAERKAIRLGLICGADEQERGVVNLKQLDTHNELRGVSLAEAIERARRLVRGEATSIAD